MDMTSQVVLGAALDRLLEEGYWSDEEHSMEDFPDFDDEMSGSSSSEKVQRLDLNALGKRKRCLPRYLFRVHSPRSGCAGSTNTEHEDLNTETAIVPHAFIGINGISQGHNSAAQITAPKQMLNAHLHTERHILSEFSSWTPSLLLAICYTEQKYTSERDAHICVIDTYNMRNGVYHVPDLFHVGLAEPWLTSKDRWSKFPAEYLVHAIVSGKSYIAVSYAKIRAQLLTVYPWLHHNRSWGTDVRRKYFAETAAAIELSDNHLTLLKNIAEQFSSAVPVFPILISFVCLTKRFALRRPAEDFAEFPELFPEFAHHEKQLRHTVEHYGVEERWLWTDKQFIGFLVEVEHTKTMMRALIWSKFGRGSRSQTSVD